MCEFIICILFVAYIWGILFTDVGLVIFGIFVGLGGCIVVLVLVIRGM